MTTAQPPARTRHLVQVLVEVMAGHRPAPQIRRWTSPGVYAVVTNRLSAAGPTGAQPLRHRPQVMSLRVCRLGPDLAEVSAVVSSGGETREALALRLRRVRGRWTVTALEAPQDVPGPARREPAD